MSFQRFVFSCHLIFDQALNNIIVCLMTYKSCTNGLACCSGYQEGLIFRKMNLKTRLAKNRIVEEPLSHKRMRSYLNMQSHNIMVGLFSQPFHVNSSFYQV